MRDIAIAFGFGRESMLMLKQLEDKDPLLVVCIGEEDTMSPDAVDYFMVKAGFRYLVIDKGFQENWKVNEIRGALVTNYYTNTILQDPAFKKLKIEKLYVGRRRKDLVERYPETFDMGKPILMPKVRGVEFPLWVGKEWGHKD